MDFEPKYSIEVEFKDFLDICQEIVQLATKRLSPRSIFELTQDEQQELIDKINQHIDFEFARKPQLKNLPVMISGYGLMFIADDVNILGAETIADDTVIVGNLDVTCALPVPTLECVRLSDDDATPIIDQTLSAMLMLDNAIYKTGLMPTGEFEFEHDLSNFNIGIPLSHSLVPVVDFSLQV